ncbi:MULTISPECIES: OsmC family protein [Actinomycetes]|uniref:OsmC family protein n=2 Tax=Actinomycetes TaxID=1760 RepID=A0ABP6M0W3_9MICC
MTTTPDDDACPLYTARVVNDGGTSGHVRAAGGPSLPTASPFDAVPAEGSRAGADPEQLLGMTWSTCLNATLEVVLAEAGITARSRVCVEVELHRERSGVGYRFVPRAAAAVEGLRPAQARVHVEAAHARCPVSKLLTGAADVSGGHPGPRVEAVEFSDLPAR